MENTSKKKVEIKDLKKTYSQETSQPLRTLAEIKKVRHLIKKNTGNNALRNLIIFNVGIDNGIRTNDILKLKTNEVLGKDEITIIESKTGKKRTVHFPKKVKNQIKTYVKERPFESEWLFPNYKDHTQPITTQAIYRMFKRITKGNEDLQGLTAHSMRRTFGYHYYKKTHDVVTLMKLFNHSSQAITLRYIGIEKEDIDKALKNFEL